MMKDISIILLMLGTSFYALEVVICSAVYKPFGADVYLPFDVKINEIVIGGTYNGTFLEDSSATIESGIRGNGLNVSDTVMTIGDRRDSCFWLPDLCSEGFTLAVWLNIGEKEGYQLFYISNGGQTGSSYGFTLHLHSGHLTAMVRTRRSNLLVRDSDITLLNEWLHVVITWNSHTHDTKLYINTVLKHSTNQIVTRYPLASSAHNGYFFGASNNAFGINHQEYYGVAILDEFLFWEEVKSYDFIHYLYDYYINEFQLTRLDGLSLTAPECLSHLTDGLNDTCVDMRMTSHSTQLCHVPAHYNPFFNKMKIRVPYQVSGFPNIKISITVKQADALNYETTMPRLAIKEGNVLSDDREMMLKMCIYTGVHNADNYNVYSYVCSENQHYIDYVYMYMFPAEICEVQIINY